SGAQLASAIAAAAAGLGLFYPGEHPAVSRRRLRAHRLPPPPPQDAEPLTPRELEVLQWLAQGLGNKQIAVRMKISEHTAKFHVAAIMGKLGAASRTQAAAIGLRRGLVLI
ncbi:MAG: response regulator transcription factor, partial [Terriglobales bacterium]